MRDICKKAMAILVAFALLLGVKYVPGSVKAAKKIKLNKSKLTIQVKKSKKLKILNTKKVKWSIKSGKKVIKIKKNKKNKKVITITGKKAGKAKVMAKVGKKKYYCTITVVKAGSKKASATPAASPKTTVEPEPETSPGVSTAEPWRYYG